MGNKEKENGAQHHTHVAYYKHVRESEASVAVIENVPEYEEKVVKKELGKGWDLASVRLDPRCFGLACARARVFMLCWRTDKVRWVSPFTLKSFVGVLLSRVVMNAGDYFFMDLPKVKLTFDVAKGEHPVKWLVETLAYGSGILDALLTWFNEILPGVEKREASQLELG
eukprot:s1099_g6.t1